jgi:ASPIC and UnbV
MRAQEAWSPTKGLPAGMVITLIAVSADSYYLTRQIGRLRVLQTGLADRNRKDSLQLLRIQNDLNSLGLAMRDMLDTESVPPYPLAAWSSPCQRYRAISTMRCGVRRSSEPAAERRKVGRGLALGDFDRDGEVDILLTTNSGPAYLFRNDQTAGNRSLRFRLVGMASNRDAIGATVRIFHDGSSQTWMVRSGSSYLSQSELPVTFGVGRRDRVDRVVVAWPSGKTEEFKNVATGRAYDWVEGKGLS